MTEQTASSIKVEVITPPIIALKAGRLRNSDQTAKAAPHRRELHHSHTPERYLASCSIAAFTVSEISKLADTMINGSISSGAS